MRLVTAVWCVCVLGIASTAGAATVTVSAGGNLQAAIDAAKPGDKLEISYVRAGKPHQATVALRNEPTREIVTRESLGEKPTAEELKMRAGWLASHVKP